MRHFLTSSLAALILLGILLTPLSVLGPQPVAEAGVLDGIITGSSCVAGAFLAPLVSSALKFAFEEGMKALLGVLVGIPGVDKIAAFFGKLFFGGAGEQKVRETALRQKESFDDTLTRCAARAFFDNATREILKVVRQGGRDGGPTYVRNWRNFETNAQYRGEAVFRGILANTKVCTYLDQELKSAFRVSDRDKISLKNQNIRSGSLDPFTLRGRCTLPDGFTIEAYSKDFAGNGGWGTFLKLLEPQNNLYGLSQLANEELVKQRALEVSADLNDALAGRGQTSVRGKNSVDSCLVRGKNNQCVVYADIKTPASYVADTLAATAQSELNWITNVDEVGEIITTLFSRLAYRVLDLSSDDPTDTYEPAFTVPDRYFATLPACPPGTSTSGITPSCLVVPSVSVTPTPSVSTSGTPPPANCQPNTNGCFVNTINNECVASQYRGDVNSSIDAVVAAGTGLEGPGSTKIVDSNVYHQAVVSQTQSRGYTAAYDGEEMGVKRSGGAISEHWDISTSTGQVRRFHASTCQPPAF